MTKKHEVRSWKTMTKPVFPSSNFSLPVSSDFYYENMSKIKTIYIGITLLVCIVLGFVVIIPEVIPSFEAIQQIIILVLYILAIVLAYFLVMRLRGYFKEQYKRATSRLLTTFATVLLIFGLFFSFVFTSLGIGQGFFGGTMVKELYYQKQKITLYLYDDGFLDPMTTIKIKHRFWPTMENLAVIENCHPDELTIWRQNDVVEITHGNIEVKVYLITRKAIKSYTE